MGQLFLNPPLVEHYWIKNEINSIVNQISQMYYAYIDRTLISSLYTTGIRVALINHLCNAQRRTHAIHLTTCAV